MSGRLDNQELTFEVGLAAKGGKPDIASFKMKGALARRPSYVERLHSIALGEQSEPDS